MKKKFYRAVCDKIFYWAVYIRPLPLLLREKMIVNVGMFCSCTSEERKINLRPQRGEPPARRKPLHYSWEERGDDKSAIFFILGPPPCIEWTLLNLHFFFYWTKKGGWHEEEENLHS